MDAEKTSEWISIMDNTFKQQTKGIDEWNVG